MHTPPTRPLFRFPGGVHPDEHKALSTQRPISHIPLSSRYVVPLRQHIGQPATPTVRAGDRVLRGQLIGQAAGRVSTTVHAPTSGIVSAVEARPIAHPSGLTDLCVVIEADGDDAAVAMTPIDWRQIPRDELLARVQALGLAGLGGAVFPSHIKLGPREHSKVPTLILNGAECEPWISCDDMLMRERAAEIMEGVAVMRHALQSDEVLIGIEDNKPEAIAAMRWAASALSFNVEVVAVPTLYPGGGGKQLTYTLTGKETPSGGISTDIGVQVFNVGTAYSLYQAVKFGQPVTTRIVTVTGAVTQPGNYEVRIGTPIHDLLVRAGGALEEATGTLIGGPMMGFDLVDPAAPVVKAVNCLLLKNDRHFPPVPPALPCIRCGQCARACPVSLQPFELYWYSHARDFGKAQAYQLFDCIECGCCSYVCPSHIPLVSYYRHAKAEIWAREQEKDASDRARERHEFHLFRLEREKREKAEKLGKKAADRLDSGAVAGDDPEAARKKAILQAAIERAQKAKVEAQPKNTDNLTAEQQREIDEIEQRRAATLPPSPAGGGVGGEGTAAAPMEAAATTPPLPPLPSPRPGGEGANPASTSAEREKDSPAS